MSDEIRELLLQEIKKRILPLEQAPHDVEAALLAAVTLRGSAGLAGEPNLAAALARLEPRLRDGDASAVQATVSLLRRASARLEEGESAIGGSWPVPPSDLEPRPIESFVRASYQAEVVDRLAGLDQCLATVDAPVETVRIAFRHVHTMKGAASAVGDEPMSWFCHGLEERLRDVADEASARVALVELGQYRGILGGLAEDPAGTLKRLRGEVEVNARVTNPPPAPPSRSSQTNEGEDDETVRVDAGTITRIVESVESLSSFREKVDAHTRRIREIARRTRQARVDLAQAGSKEDSTEQRVLAAVADDLDAIASGLREAEGTFGTELIASKRLAAGLLLTTMESVFSRLASVIEAEGRRLDREVKVRVVGLEEPVDRRVAERLVEPCIQVARNAVAHGIESPDARKAAGKDPVGAITLSAKRVADRLHVTISDDGAGVDLGRVRQHALERGLLSPERAANADEALLLSLLLRPGFSTQAAPDLLAGRGIGLDIALYGIQKLGGSLRLMSRHGQGFSARIEVPVDAAVGGVRIEKMTESDVPHVGPMIELTGTKDADTQRKAAMTRLREELGRPWARVRVARGPQGDVLGMLVAWQIADEVHVLDVLTKAAVRRRGIGRALMNELIVFARGLPVRHLLLEVRRSNAPAIHLYRSLGFFATNVRKRYYDDGEDAVEMRLVLDEVTREVRLMPDEIVLDTP